MKYFRQGHVWTEIYFWPSSRCQIWYLVRAAFSYAEWHLAPVWSSSGRQKATILSLFHKCRTSWPNHLQKAPYSKAITLGIRIQHTNWGGGGEAQSIIFNPNLPKFISFSHAKYILPQKPWKSQLCPVSTQRSSPGLFKYLLNQVWVGIKSSIHSEVKSPLAMSLWNPII